MDILIALSAALILLGLYALTGRAFGAGIIGCMYGISAWFHAVGDGWRHYRAMHRRYGAVAEAESRATRSAAGTESRQIETKGE